MTLIKLGEAANLEETASLLEDWIQSKFYKLENSLLSKRQIPYRNV